MYQLNRPGKDYTNLYGALRQYDYIRDNSLNSVWFISTMWTAAQVYDHLRHYLDITDRIVITQLRTGEHQGWANRDIWTWVNSRI